MARDVVDVLRHAVERGTVAVVHPAADVAADVEEDLAEARLLQLARDGQVVGDFARHPRVAADGLEGAAPEHDDLADGEGQPGRGQRRDQPERKDHGGHDVGCRDDELLSEGVHLLEHVARNAVRPVPLHVRHGPGDALRPVDGVGVRKQQVLPGAPGELLHGVRLAEPALARGSPLRPARGPGTVLVSRDDLPGPSVDWSSRTTIS